MPVLGGFNMSVATGDSANIMPYVIVMIIAVVVIVGFVIYKKKIKK